MRAVGAAVRWRRDVQSRRKFGAEEKRVATYQKEGLARLGAADDACPVAMLPLVLPQYRSKRPLSRGVVV